MPAVGDLVQTTTRPWITHPPTHCTNGRRLGPGELLVGHQARLGDSGGHTSCTWRTPGSTIYSNSWWEHHHRLDRPPAGIPTRPVSATRNGGAIGTDRLGMALGLVLFVVFLISGVATIVSTVGAIVGRLR